MQDLQWTLPTQTVPSSFEKLLLRLAEQPTSPRRALQQQGCRSPNKNNYLSSPYLVDHAYQGRPFLLMEQMDNVSRDLAI